MSFIAKLFLDNTERIVHNANILFSQGVDFIGRPCTFPQGGLINIKVDRTHEDLFFEWAVSPTMMKEGYIRFYKPDGMSKFVDLEFWDCYCVDYSENFSHNTPEAMYIDLALSPGVLRFRDIVFEKHWKVKDLNRKDTAPITYRANDDNEDTVTYDKPQILECNYLDADDNIIDKLDVIEGDTKIFIVIKTKNMIGKKITIDLSSQKRDYIYNGKELENDTLSNYTIQKDTEKIELLVKINK